MFPGSDLIALLIYLFILLVLVRGLLSWFPGALYTEPGRLIVLATEWFLAPIRRVIPPAGGFDISFIVAILILYFVRDLVSSGSIGRSLLGILGTALFLLIILMLLRVFFMFFHMDPWHPIVQMVMQASEPFARPFRGWFPRRHGQFDWAPVAGLIALVAIWLVLSNLPRFGIF